MRYAFLILAVASLGLLGVLHKVADHRKCRPAAINFFLFLWASLMVAAVELGWRGAGTALPIPGVLMIAVAVTCGTFASLAILSFQHGVRYGKISTSWLLLNLSTAIPTLLSILIYHEHVGWKRGLSLLLAVSALLLLWRDRRAEELQDSAAKPGSGAGLQDKA
jgi:drug/metabolite transporter (DMT)-like permease